MRGFQQRGSAPRGHGGSRHHGGPQGPQPTLDKPKREAILDLAKYVNSRIRVKFTGGREGVCNLSPLAHLRTNQTATAPLKKKQ
jgi:hypothetical protein